MQLSDLGLNTWFEDKIDNSKLSEFQLARVISVNKDNYILRDKENEIQAELAGKLQFSAESPLDFPGVGDWVYAQYFNENSQAIIHEILPRKTVLKRKTPGKKIELQLIASNIDTALIIQSIDTDYNLNRLERYLVMVTESGIRPVLLLSKTDLVTQEEQEEKVSGIRKAFPEMDVLAFSNIGDSGRSIIEDVLRPKETYCLLGSSGVGKTTLLNSLIGEELFDTFSVRETDGRGRHTTSRRQLTILKNGAMIIDTPGMREIGNFGVNEGFQETFKEITELSKSCKFNNCTHTSESGCAVLTGVKDGVIPEERYRNYIKMSKETAYLEMSYLEKRRKDKNFGKFIKRVMKNKVKK